MLLLRDSLWEQECEELATVDDTIEGVVFLIAIFEALLLHETR